MRLLLSYDPYAEDFDDEEGGLIFSEDLNQITTSIFSKYDKVNINGNLGFWTGPAAVSFVIDDPERFMEFVSKGDVIELYYADDEETVGEFQRYSKQWSLPVPKGSLVLKQYHHDGCNVFYILPIIKKKDNIFRPEDLPW